MLKGLIQIHNELNTDQIVVLLERNKREVVREVLTLMRHEMGSEEWYKSDAVHAVCKVFAVNKDMIQ